MRPSVAAIAALLTLTACAPAATTTATTAPAPAAARPTTPITSPAPMARLGDVPLNWHLLDPSEGMPGMSVLRAERELLKGRQPVRVVTVAVIDGGVDTAHAGLIPHLWTNAKETPGNGRDDDNNGFADDVRGWNFIGARDGKNINEDTFEVTRLAALCGDTATRARVPMLYRQSCGDILTAFTKKRVEAEQTMANVDQIDALFGQILPVLKRAARTETLTVAKVSALPLTSDSVRIARQMFLQLAASGITVDDVVEAKKAYGSQLKYGYNLTFDPRGIVGDAYPDTTQNRYGNRDVTGPDPSHGTHVAGIIGAIRDNGGTGLAQSVRIIAIRAVPDGDERDKDVANAIRYATDLGAQIINMSFGKAYSPYKPLVDAAVKYADSKGVLMVHAAGNDGEDVTVSPSFPTPAYTGGGQAVNWIEVGATTWKSGGRDSLVAAFSNYGKTRVDVFAPGEDIYSTVPGGGYKKNSGTSMASPVVAGLAAMLMSYYPTLTATDVKRVILESSIKPATLMVAKPGEAGGMVKFADLSISGGIVNAYNAVLIAEQLTASRP